MAVALVSFLDIELDSLGNPLEEWDISTSTKGVSKELFDFKNLSGGEKAVFDLVLDLVVGKSGLRRHDILHRRTRSRICTRGYRLNCLSVLYELIPDNCQLMLATHSIGMMRRARDIESAQPGSVVFLDFGDLETSISNR